VLQPQKQGVLVTKAKAYELIKNSGGKIIHVTFTKKNGEVRKMACRTAVKKYLRGGSLSYNPALRMNIIVFDVAIKEYRTIKASSVIRIAMEGSVYTVN